VRNFASGRRFVSSGREALETSRAELEQMLPWLRGD